MRHFLDQFGPALEWPWTRLTDVPVYDDALVDLIAGQSDAQSGHLSIRELERLRDDNLVAILRALRARGSAAGAVIAAHEATLPGPVAGELPVTLERRIPPDWTDYNGHVNEARYLDLGSQASDGLMVLVGADPDYVAGGFSFFTAESHVRYLAELCAGDGVRATTQVLGGEGRKLHLFHSIARADGTPAATVETLLLHVDLSTRRSCAPGSLVAERIAALAADHARLPWPEGAGRHVGQPRASRPAEGPGA
jgi:carnitine 3-dehydrogenase